MGRLPRLTADDLVYHALNRGNNRTDIFADDDDHQAFLVAMANTQKRYAFRLLGYCLMTNHFHLLLRPGPGQSISRILQSLTIAHTWRYHRRHHTVGHVWQGRFKSPVVQGDEHLLTVLRYIEANPLRAGMVSDLSEYRWSSYQSHGLGRPDHLLSPMPELDALGRSPSERRARWRRKVQAAQGQDEIDRIRASLRTGKPLGRPEFVEATAQRLGINLNARPRGRPRKTEKRSDTNIPPAALRGY
jgi:putative transposase